MGRAAVGGGVVRTEQSKAQYLESAMGSEVGFTSFSCLVFFACPSRVSIHSPMTSPLFAARKDGSDQARQAVSILEGPGVEGGSVDDLRRRTRVWTVVAMLDVDKIASSCLCHELFFEKSWPLILPARHLGRW